MGRGKIGVMITHQAGAAENELLIFLKSFLKAREVKS
jgi:hypothetical protein